MNFPKLNDEQFDKLADITSDLGLVAIAAVVLPAILEKFNLWQTIIGSVVAFAFWIFSLNLVKRR